MNFVQGRFDFDSVSRPVAYPVDQSTLKVIAWSMVYQSRSIDLARAGNMWIEGDDVTRDSGSSSSGSSSTSRWSSPDANVVQEYEALMAARLGIEFSSRNKAKAPSQGSDNDVDAEEAARPRTKAEKLNAKKKRRKERERAAREEHGNMDGQARNLDDIHDTLRQSGLLL